MTNPSIARTFHNRFDSPLHHQWKHDRANRCRVPFREAWRGCLGLAALIEGPDSAIHHYAGRMLVANDKLRWLCLRDIPPGHFAGTSLMNCREVNYVNSTHAQLRFGLPTLNFNVPDRHVWDFRFMPLGHNRSDVLHSDRFPREFAILNLISAGMTHFAFTGLDTSGRPFRRPWLIRRPAHIEPGQILDLDTVMPTAYLAFQSHQIEQLYQRITQSGSNDGGDSPLHRRFSMAFRNGFCQALAKGLPLHATGPMIYLGPACRFSETNMQVHHFKCTTDGREITLSLPTDARIYVLPYQPGVSETPIPAGAVFGRALGQLPAKAWMLRNPVDRWSTRQEPCGTKAMLDHLQKLWFLHQGLCLPSVPDTILFPSSLVATACRDIRPSNLVWDFSVAASCFQADLNAWVLPPLPLWNWNHLRLVLPGDIDLNAGIADPRFNPCVGPAPERLLVRSRRAVITMRSPRHRQITARCA